MCVDVGNGLCMVATDLHPRSLSRAQFYRTTSSCMCVCRACAPTASNCFPPMQKHTRGGIWHCTSACVRRGRTGDVCIWIKFCARVRASKFVSLYTLEVRSRLQARLALCKRGRGQVACALFGIMSAFVVSTDLPSCFWIVATSFEWIISALQSEIPFFLVWFLLESP